MATRKQILEVLEMLSEYHNRTLNDTQVGIYLRQLSELDPYSLREAAYEWINQSRFFPKVNELRATAARFPPPPPPDPLEAAFDALKRRFLVDGSLDLDAWSELEQRFESARRPGEAQHLRSTLRHLQQDYDADGNFLESAKQKYRQWQAAGD